MAWLSDVYLLCAAVGGTVLVLQTILLVVGGGDHDAHADAGHAPGGDAPHDAGDLAFVKWLSIRTVVAALTFFGLAGLAAEHGGLAPVASLLVALASGAAAVFAVGFLMASLSRLQSRGNVDLARNAVGRVGTVYLRVPAAGQGRGKVTVVVQGRSVEVEATTAGAEIPTGAEIRVVSVASPELVEVAPL